jgi:exopolyphosphatase/guanosine-5'-triphosphate,3'-diphosphate pyrophosphatase
MRIAVVDLGTNTFNLLIVETSGNNSYKIVFNNKLPVKLGEGGINKNEITKDAFQRGIDAMAKHSLTIGEYRVTATYAFGTAALRDAENGELFIRTIREEFNIRVELITGDREAELIYLGVKQAMPLDNNKVLILDIGGGSNEFIIANKKQIFWKYSYKLGIAKLLDQFKPSDPIRQDEMENVIRYIDEELQTLFTAVRNYKIDTLIGASGSFETFTAMIKSDDENFESETGTSPFSTIIDVSEFTALHKRLVASTIEERRGMKGLEPMRIEMIVLASLFVKFILDKLAIQNIVQSNFALKEGVIYELLYKEKK